jgi:hypothetical protein
MTTPDEATLFYLNSHGQPFQDAAISACAGVPVHDSWLNTRQWSVLDREIPVELNGKEFHIDAVLRFPDSDHEVEKFLIVECKRTDPKFSEWVFARSIARQSIGFIADRIGVNRDSTPPTLSARAIQLPMDATKGYDFRTERKVGDLKGNGGGRKLDEAIAQVMRGVGGFAGALPEWHNSGRPCVMVPMIVTTGTLVTIDEPMESASLETGELPTITRNEVNWCWLSTNVNRSLMPRISFRNDGRTWGSFYRRMTHESVRGIVITNTAGLADAMRATTAALHSSDLFVR